MNFKKIVAAVAAAAIAVSAMAVNAFALTAENYLKDGTVYINADKETDPNWTKDSGVAITDVYGVTYHVTFNADEVAVPETWIGGGIGANSNSTGWLQNEWGRVDKPIIADLENGTITWLSDAPIFAEGDAYAQFWLQTWGGTVTINSADILGKDGAILSVEGEPVAAEEETPAETEAATEEEAAPAEEEVADDEAAEEEVAAVEEDAAEEEAAPEADTTTEAAATGNVAVASIAGVMALAAAAAVVSKKRN